MIEAERTHAGPTDDVDGGQRHRGRGRDVPGATRDDHERGRRQRVDRRRGGEQAPDGGAGRRQPQECPIARGVAPRRQGELAQAIADPEAIERHAQPADDRVEVRVAEAAGQQGGVRHDRPLNGRLTGVPVHRGRRRGGDPRAGGLPDLDDLHPAAEDVGQGRRGGDQRAAAVRRVATQLLEQQPQRRAATLGG